MHVVHGVADVEGGTDRPDAAVIGVVTKLAGVGFFTGCDCRREMLRDAATSCLLAAV